MNDILNPEFILNGGTNQSLIKVWLPAAQRTWSGDIVELEEFLKDAKKAYYTSSETIIEDVDYDALEDILKKMKPDSIVLSGIGLLDAPEGENVKVKHDRPMGSLTKKKTKEDLQKFLAKFPKELFFAMCKIDGCSLSLVYVKGKLKLAKTRGDGDVGEDVTHNALVIPSIPKILPAIDGKTFSGEIRGEAVIFKTDFQRINDEHILAGKKTFANARNMAAGALGQKNSAECAKRCVSFVSYNIFPANSDIEYMSEKFALLERLGFNVVHHVPFINDGEVAFDIIHKEFPTGMNFGFDTDGVVLMPEAFSHWDVELGSSNNRPNYAIAWKWEAETKTTKVLDIVWQVGRTGKIVPIAKVEPVSLSGATVTSVTLHNAEFLIEYNISVGVEIFIQRSNEVIPKCLGRASAPLMGTDEIKASIPAICPECGEVVMFDGTQLWCENPVCRAREIARLCHFIGTSNIKGLGEAIVTGLYDGGIVTRVNHFFEMFAQHDEDVLAAAVGGYGVLRVVKAAIQGKTEYTESELLKSIGMEAVGDGTSERLVAAFGLEDTVNKALFFNEAIQLFSTVKDIGEKTAQDIVHGIHQHQDEIEAMRKLVKVVPDFKPPTDGKLSGKTFLLTGTMTRKRSDIETDIVANGGVIGSIKKDPNFFLVMGEDADGSSKHAKAIKVGANIITEADLRAMMQ